MGIVVNPNLTLAILRYEGAPHEEPDGSTNSTATDLLHEKDLHLSHSLSSLIHPLIFMQALINPGSPGGDVPADVTFNMAITQVRNPPKVILWRRRFKTHYQPNPPYYQINGVSYEPPTLPTLLQILSGASSPNDFLPHDNMVLLPENAIVEVVVIGNPEGVRFGPLLCFSPF